MLTIKRAAEALGVPVGRAYGWAETRYLPAVHLDHDFRVDPLVMLDWALTKGLTLHSVPLELSGPGASVDLVAALSQGGTERLGGRRSTTALEPNDASPLGRLLGRLAAIGIDTDPLLNPRSDSGSAWQSHKEIAIPRPLCPTLAANPDPAVYVFYLDGTIASPLVAGAFRTLVAIRSRRPADHVGLVAGLWRFLGHPGFFDAVWRQAPSRELLFELGQAATGMASLE